MSQHQNLLVSAKVPEFCQLLWKNSVFKATFDLIPTLARSLTFRTSVKFKQLNLKVELVCGL